MKIKQIRVDGYKNLINCEINLGDFNVLVGPNNSGKSNLLEAFNLLGDISFGGPEKKEWILKGLTPRQTADFSISHLIQYKNMPISIGITFEIIINDVLWTADYDVTIQCAVSEEKKGSFISEILTGKPYSRSGRTTKYISRTKEQFNVITKSGRKKRHKITQENSCLTALPSIYPDPKQLPNELVKLYYAIHSFARTPIFAFSPSQLRKEIDKETTIRNSWVSSFDLGLVLDNIKETGTYYELFKESMCDIMTLESIELIVEVKKSPSKKTDDNGAEKRIRYIIAQRHGDRPSLIEEYSDGTLVAAAVITALFSDIRSGPMLCLEELETCLHPAALGKLICFLQEHAHKWPVLITTHSPYVLNCVKPEDVNVAIVDETGATHFKKVENTKQLRDYLKSGFMSFGDMLASNFEDILGK
ncbi:MAG: AAA family ATPase [Sedimentisphaerales bacterium]|nr:AAA family ATPase [Sedimentisphaerales bacterium]